jgi:CBS domain containing-hemolysin-like protein
LEIFLPEGEDYETIAGLLGDVLEHVPQEGEEASVAAIDREGTPLVVILKVERTEGRRVDKIRLSIDSGHILQGDMHE